VRPPAGGLARCGGQLPLRIRVTREGQHRQLRMQISDRQDGPGTTEGAGNEDEIGGTRIQPAVEGVELFVQAGEIAARVLQADDRKLGEGRHGQAGS
jgi:hypothetical protein